MRVIAITAGKGVVGKTTLTANLGVALTKLGFRVCVVDANFTAPDLATHFGMYPETTLWDVLKGKESISDAIYEHTCGLHIIPGSSGVEGFKPNIYKRLRRKIRNLRYDFLLIDTPPGLGEDAKAALLAANEVLIVANPEWTSLANAYRMMQFAINNGKKITGVVLNRTMVHEYEPNERMVESIMGVQIVGKIPEDVNVRKSIAVQSPIVLLYPDAPASREILHIAMELGGIERPAGKSLLRKIIEFLGL